jgi:hypothetical protein
MELSGIEAGVSGSGSEGTMGLVLAPTGSQLVCTLEGGASAVQERVGEWRKVVNLAVERRPATAGVTLVYRPDATVAVELARLAAAEFACCSFFTFTLRLDPAGMALTVTAPPEAASVITAMFGAYGPVTGAAGEG